MTAKQHHVQKVDHEHHHFHHKVDDGPKIASNEHLGPLSSHAMLASKASAQGSPRWHFAPGDLWSVVRHFLCAVFGSIGTTLGAALLSGEHAAIHAAAATGIAAAVSTAAKGLLRLKSDTRN